MRVLGCDFGYLAWCDGCCDDAEDSFWRYLAVKRKTLIGLLTCALLALSTVGCGAFQGTTNHLQSIQISTSNTAESAGSTLTLYGIGGTIQLYTWANYSNGKHVLLSGTDVAYQISITPGSEMLGADPNLLPLTNDPNADPPQTVQLLTPNGLLTAVTPFVCTWINTATTGTTPAFAIIGSYTVTGTYQGMTTPPAFVTVASAFGWTSTTNPQGLCTNPPAGQ